MSVRRVALAAFVAFVIVEATQAQRSTSTVFTAADATLVTYLRMPTLGTNTTFSYGGLAGRYVGGVLHFYVYGSNTGAARTRVESAASPTTVVVTAGAGATFPAGTEIDIKRRATPQSALPEHRRVAELAGDTLRLDTPLGGTPSAGDVIVKTSDYLYELADPGTGYSTTYTAAPRATFVEALGDVYQGHRVSWEPGGALIFPLQYTIPASVTYNEKTRLLYLSWYDAYNVTGRPDMSLSAYDPATHTAYGPWRFRATDTTGKTRYGSGRCMFISVHPDTGKVLCSSSLNSGNSTSSWGPALFSGADFPTAATPAGLGAPDLELPARHMDFPFPGNCIDGDGRPTCPFKSMRYTNFGGLTYINEPKKFQTGAVDPAANKGIGSWTEATAVTGVAMVRSGSKRGVFFAMHVPGGYSSDPTNCVDAAHVWYSNAGLGHGKCNHGCDPPVLVTGPVSTRSVPALGIRDPDALPTNSATDWQQSLDSLIDLEKAFSLRTLPNTEIAGKSIDGLYWDEPRQYLWGLSRQADTANGNTSLLWAIRFNTAAAPQSAALLPLAGFLVVVLAPARRRGRVTPGV